jgi:type I restriction enzyme S subunit
MVDNVYKESIREIPLFELVWLRSARRPERVEEYPFKGSVPYIDIKTLESATPSRYTEASNFIMSKQDLVMVKDGHRSGKAFHGKEGVAASTLIILSQVSNDISLDYLYCYLAYRYDDFQNRKRGTAVGHLDMRYLRDLLIPVPEMDIQRDVAEKYQHIEKLADETKLKALRLKELSTALDNKSLKAASENLQQQVEMMKKAWLHQIFDRVL